MPSDSDSHLRPEEIVRYSAGEASDHENSIWEEHLLFCGECRQKVSEEDYRTAMRSAARELRRASEAAAPSAVRRMPRWVPAAAVVALAIMAAALLAWWKSKAAPF